MNVLLVIASKKEAVGLDFATEKSLPDNSSVKRVSIGKVKVDILVTGVGTTLTTYHLTRQLSAKKYSLVINAGIAGSFHPDLRPGAVVQVVEEQFADTGIEDKGRFLTLFEAGLENGDAFPYKDGALHNSNNFNLPPLNALPKVRSVTSNTAHGNAKSIESLRIKFNPEIETMEGGAVFYVCLKEGIPFFELRSISNMVEPRNIKNWNIPLALKNLKQTLQNIFEDLNRIFVK